MFFAAIAIVCIWAFCEAVFFFIVADVPIMAVALKWGWKRGLLVAILAALFASLGGLIVYGMSATLPELMDDTIMAVPGINQAMLDNVRASYGQGSFSAMLIGAFSGEPYKLYAFTAGLERVPMFEFTLHSFFARLPRFALIAVISGWIGRALRHHINGWQLWAIFGLAWTAFYAWYFSVVGW